MPTRLLRRVLIGLGLSLVFAPANLWAHGDLDARIAALSNILATNSSDPEVYFRRAELYRVHEQHSLALADYQRVLLLNPSSDAARLGMSDALLRTGKPIEARASVDTVIRKYPENTEAWLARARILTSLGEKQEAVADYSKALSAVSRPTPELYLERAALLADLGKIDEAVAGLEEGVKRLGHVPPLELQVVELELRQNRPDAALARLDEQIARAPRKEFLQFRRAALLEKLGRVKEARASYQAGLDALGALPPQQRNVPAVRSLAEQIHAALKRLGKAAESLQAAALSP